MPESRLIRKYSWLFSVGPQLSQILIHRTGFGRRVAILENMVFYDYL